MMLFTRLSFFCLIISLVVLYSGNLAFAAKLTVLHSFCSIDYCTDGSDPEGTVAIDPSGNVYGTTVGSDGYYNAYPYGTLFRYSSKGVFTTLHAFCSETACDDGIFPQSDITIDAKGDLYGTTTQGGVRAQGTVFELPTSDRLSVLHYFCATMVEDDCTDGENPQGSVVVDADGNVYGNTSVGGNFNDGLLYEKPLGKSLVHLHDFCTASDCVDGENPDGRLLLSGGVLYGVTYYGGAHGNGEVFKLVLASRKLTVLYSFCRLSDCADGAYPRGGLVRDSAGNLYGVTNNGGLGQGVLFRISPAGAYAIMHKFCTLSYCTDGSYPNGGLAINAGGVVYGTTNSGGNESGSGILFEYKIAAKHFGVVYNFCTESGCNDGNQPSTEAGVAVDSTGNLYGTTRYGGKNDSGVLYKIVP